ncbi:MAG: ABC transporter permease [Candidatus Omnitrophica bacterium]|nr:ABC transporter permease [Candidatus Omnitrophota bacterium]
MPLLGFAKEDLRMVYNFFKMNLKDRYIGSILGVYWAFINPLLMLSIYTFVFAFIFKARVPVSEESLPYAVWLISGLAPWLGISEGMNTGCNGVVMHSEIVKNTVFKTEVLPIASSLMGIVPLFVSSVFLFVLIFFSGGRYTIHILWLMPVVLLQVAFTLGVSFFTSAVTVFIRDVSQLINSLLLLCLFFTPIFYSRQMMPSIVQKITFFNPFYQIIDGYRSCVIYNRIPNIAGLLYLFALDIILFYAGINFFRKLKGYFGPCL